MRKVLATAALAAMMTGTAYAGDLGGSCCADLEERLAELESVAVHKGNKKVSLTLSGSVSRALLWMKSDDSTDHRFVDNTNSPTRFTLSGEGKIGKDMSAGFVYEMGLGNEPSVEDFLSYPNSNDDLGVRHAAVWFKTLAGKVTLGKTSQATDNFDEMSVANTTVASKLLSLGPVSAVYLFGFDLPFDGNRKNLVRYDSPVLQGFMVSGSWSDENAWDGALRYAGEFGGFRMAAGVGYRQDDALAFSVFSLPVEYKTMLATASVMHVATGLFATGMYADTDFSGTHLKAWHLQGGIEARLTELGKTTFYAEFGQLDLGDKVDAYGFGAVQRLDAANLDLFVAYRNYDDSVSTVLTGMRIGF